MQRALLLVVVLLLPLASAQHSPYAVVLDWDSGRFLAAAPTTVDEVNAFTRGPFSLSCEKTLLLDLALDPDRTAVLVPGAGELSVRSEVKVEVLREGEAVSELTLRAFGHGTPIAVVGPGEYELRVTLTLGQPANWDMRLRSWEAPTSDCGHPVG